MACEIAARAKKATVLVYQPDSGEFNTYNDCAGGSVAGGETVLVFNWAQDSNDLGFGFSEAAGDALFAALMQYRKKTNPEAFKRMHFIGHSRGAVVNSEATERLLAAGEIFEDLHVTTLDPHDSGAAGIQFIDYDDVNSFQNGIVVWEGITFADNYYQRQEPLMGRAIKGAANLELRYEDIMPCLAFVGVPAADACHSKVVSLYRKTILDELERERLPWYSYSRVGGGSLPANILPETNPRLQFEKSGIVNGDFEKGTDAGWAYHGGINGGRIVEDSSGEHHLALGSGEERTHNRFYIPPKAERILFQLRPVAAEAYQLKFKLGAEDKHPWCVPTEDSEIQRCSVELRDHSGSMQTMTFSSPSFPDPFATAGSTPSTLVRFIIDNVRFEMTQ